MRVGKDGFIGVSLQKSTKLKNPWKAYILHNGHYQTIGYFATKEDAANAYNRMATQYFGKNAVLNTLPPTPST